MRRTVPVLALGLALAACAAKSGVEPSSLVESALIAETARYAGVMGVRGRGEITDHANEDQKKHEVVGWWSGGVAWYYRPNVERFIGVVPGDCPEAPRCEVPANVAVHELAHSVHPQHDWRHWCLCARYATPTYPWPGPGAPACN